MLRSARWPYNKGRRLSKAEAERFWDGYRYRRKHGAWMPYAAYRRRGLLIGSGVTEAVCKTVFAEGLKRSGMTWGQAGGQVIVDLRVLVLSRVWQQVHQSYLTSRPQPTIAQQASNGTGKGRRVKKTA